MAEYWFIFRIQLYGRDELVGRVNYACNHFLKDVVWKFLDWLEKYCSVREAKIKTFHLFRYPRNLIRFRVLIEGDNINVGKIKAIQNEFTDRTDKYTQADTVDNFLDNDAGIDFNNEKTLNSVATPYGGDGVLWLALDFMNIMARLNRILMDNNTTPTEPYCIVENVNQIVNYIYSEIFGVTKEYPCICGKNIPISESIFDFSIYPEPVKQIHEELIAWKQRFLDLKANGKITVEMEDLAKNYSDLAYLSFGVFTLHYTCYNCGELLDIKIR